MFKITASGKSIPPFMAYLSKEDKQKNKEILLCLELGTTEYIKNPKFTKEEWECSLLFRFDFVIKKVVSASIKESTENFDEETIHQTWFYALDAIFKIKA